MPTWQKLRATVLAIALVSGGLAKAWSPGTTDPTVVQGFTVDTTTRLDVLSFYNTVYFASQNFAADMDWTGEVSTDTPGTTSLTFKEDVRRRVNFYRALNGLTTNITFSDSDSSNDQLDALMNSANGQLSHMPPTTWTDYTAGAALAAGNSNLSLGAYGPDAIDGYMYDGGSNNYFTGHRRWIQYTGGNIMGTGDIPPDGTFPASNALWVIGNFNSSAPAQFIMWPNRGYTPFPLLPARWSLSYPGADFTNATVTMTQGANSVPVTYDSKTDDGYGDNTIVWEPANLPTSISGDTTYSVTVSGIASVPGITSETYTVTLFDPNVLGQSVAISGTTQPPTTGAAYTFNAITEADAYDLQVSTGSAAAWNEGAETTPAPQVIASTTGTYPLEQSAVFHTGAKAFQLTFPADLDPTGMFYRSTDFSNQGFEITRLVVPTSISQLQFYTRFGYVASTTTLSALVSTDNGTTWTQVWSTPGTNSPSSTWTLNNASLAAYAGQVILVEFVLNGNGQSVYLGTDSSTGFFLDDITVTNSTLLTNVTDTSLANSATSFMLNSTTAGSALVAGTGYYLRIRPEVGLRWYGFGAFELVTAQTAGTPTGYSSWVSTYPGVTGGATGDDSNDGIANGIKYAFGLDPTVRNAPSSIPSPVLTTTSLHLSYTAPAGIVGVTYGAQWSSDMVNWNTIHDTGTGNVHTFDVNATVAPTFIPGTPAFIRQRIIINP